MVILTLHTPQINIFIAFIDSLGLAKEEKLW